ncbi:MAG TPA: peptidylprolyl isomerase [Spongiibacteraceae bacterium]|nr:peptidylprolyl isomerase [Spongiibacteraceae bacterium]HUH37489.1 peptidylprolyl isomerase [Spongiibacteraceae bacterium]
MAIATTNRRFRAGIFALLAALTLGAHAQQQLDRIIAIVDDDVILASELYERVQQATAGLQQSGRELPSEDRLQNELLNRLIVESIQLQMAERAGVRINDQQLNEAMTDIAERNGMNLEQFALALEQQGMGYNAMREQLRRDLAIQRVQQGNVIQRIQVTDQEIDNFLASEEGRAATAPEYRVLHALVPVPSGADAGTVAAAKALAETLAAKARNQVDFNAAVAHSGRFTVEGSDLGWRPQRELPSVLTDAVTGLEPGEVADPLQSASGFHIIKLADARGVAEIIQQTRVRHILLKPSAIRSDEQTRALAEKLRAQAQAGAAFSDLAREYSEDIGSAMEGGDLGWTSPGQLVPEFEATMEKTAAGEISEPVKTRYGWHIILVEERRRQDVTEELRRNLASNHLRQRKYQEELEAWLQKIRDEAYVDIKLNS